MKETAMQARYHLRHKTLNAGVMRMKKIVTISHGTTRSIIKKVGTKWGQHYPQNQKRPCNFRCKALYLLAPRDGLEPPT